MKVDYLLNISSPNHHYASVKQHISDISQQKQITIFMPAWSPGSYLIRDYARFIRKLTIVNKNGQHLEWKQNTKSSWIINLKGDTPENTDTDTDDIFIEYEVYCHDLTVRTSHITDGHAFLHGPSLFMGVLDTDFFTINLNLEITFPQSWNKISTSLDSISNNLNKFKYVAKNYDYLLDCPIEIGCHYTNGFLVNGIEHNIAISGTANTKTVSYQKIVNDIKTVVETVLKTTKEIPYKSYTFLIRLQDGLYGGLEHLSSCALYFCASDIETSKGYADWIALVSHEYFHTWNVKRIRPIELGPFDYMSENYTRMHWLTEGLTSFVDELFAIRTGLITEQQYLAMQVKNLNRYFANRGKYFDSLEDSSFNAWIKLYMPTENSNNNTISYYLKGGISFFILHTMLAEKGKKIDDFIAKLWELYKKNPSKGIIKSQVYAIISNLIDDVNKKENTENCSGEKFLNEFSDMIETTKDLKILEAFSKIGVSVEMNEPSINMLWTLKEIGNSAIITRITDNGAAFCNGFAVGDEIIAIDKNRVKYLYLNNLHQHLKTNVKYRFTIVRDTKLIDLDCSFSSCIDGVRELKINDEKKFKAFYNIVNL